MFTFKYHGDRVVCYPKRYFSLLFLRLTWFISRSSTDKLFNDKFASPFFSQAYGEYFNHFSGYWQMVGKKNALLEVLQRRKSLSVIGFSLKETLCKFTRSEYPNTPVVVFFDVSAEGIARLLQRLPGSKISTFMEEVICIQCKTREEAKKIVQAAPSSVGEAFAVLDGVEIGSNDRVSEEWIG